MKFSLDNYHTRIIKRFIVAILSVFLMVSCNDSKYDFGFKSTSQALDCYQSFCDETKGKEIAHSEDVVSVLKEWKEVRDTVLSFLQKDSAYYVLSFRRILLNVSTALAVFLVSPKWTAGLLEGLRKSSVAMAILGFAAVMRPRLPSLIRSESGTP